MVGILITSPGMVTDRLQKSPEIDMNTLDFKAEMGGFGDPDADPMRGF